MNSQNLKPCPFCGSEIVSIKTRYDDDGSDAIWKYVQCGICRVETHGKWHTQGNDCLVFYQEVRDQWSNRVKD